MREFGIIKKIDKQGRIVLPKNFRERYFPDGIAEIIATDNGILLRKPKLIIMSRREKTSRQEKE